ncbi:MAG TPA: substrate-binding domain-containing protein [Arenibaculum sp.]|nr:substrate-binding domain-containing protein [Arenibaculum sp.]
MQRHLCRAVAVAAAITAACLIPAEPARAQMRDQIRITGSSTVFPFTAAVAEDFVRRTGARTPVVESSGTGGGFKQFCSGVGATTPDLVGASRPITASERADCERNGVSAVAMRIGYDGIVLASARAEPPGVTAAQLWRALARRVPVDGAWVANPNRTWQDVDPDLPDTPIRVFGPGPTSGTRDELLELVMDPGCASMPEPKALSAEARARACRQIRDDGAYVDAGEDDNLIVQKVINDTDAFGLLGYNYLSRNANLLDAAAIEGVLPTDDTIFDGSYSLSRPLYVYVKQEHVGRVRDLAGFVSAYAAERNIGPDGRLADKGLIALPPEGRKAARAVATGLRGGAPRS